MPTVRRFRSRRYLLGTAAVAALLFGLAMLHPYPRQSLFGPTTRGRPWCAWEEEVRLLAIQQWGREDPTTLTARIRHSLGVPLLSLNHGEIFDHADMLPLIVKLADDKDPIVKMLCNDAILNCKNLHRDAALPLLRNRLDGSGWGRLLAVKAIWQINKDTEMIPIALKALKEEYPQIAASSIRNGPPPSFRAAALAVVGEMACDAPDLLSVLLTYAHDEDKAVRESVAASLGRIGLDSKVAASTLEGMLQDKEESVRTRAAKSLKERIL